MTTASERQGGATPVVRSSINDAVNGLSPAASNTLVGISYSPWTEKAKWALDHQKIPYRYSEHLILLGMPALRLKARKIFGDVTVPTLITNEKIYGDSFEIAAFSGIFSKNEIEKIRTYNELSEQALDASRALLLDRLVRDEEALKENIPKFVPRFLCSVSIPLVRLGIWYIKKAFSSDQITLEEHEEKLVKILEKFQDDLKNSGGQYLLGRFSYADIVLAVCLQFISPLPEAYLKVGPGMRRCCENTKISNKFSYLIEWRDALYKKHRYS